MCRRSLPSPSTYSPVPAGEARDDWSCLLIGGCSGRRRTQSNDADVYEWAAVRERESQGERAALAVRLHGEPLATAPLHNIW